MLQMDNILFIVEGEKEEPLIIKTLISKFLGKRINAIISYNSNIHQLYEELYNDDDIDIIRLLKSQGKLDGLKIRPDQISEKYLFFDLDPHDEAFKKSGFNNVKNLMEYFNNETENGKLYINYPFSEALYEPPTQDFLQKTVIPSRCKIYKRGLKSDFINHPNVKSTYQNCVSKFFPRLQRDGIASEQRTPNKWKYLWYYRISLHEWRQVIHQHIKKSLAMTNSTDNEDLNNKVFNVQRSQYAIHHNIYIISIYGIFLYEYFDNPSNVF